MPLLERARIETYIPDLTSTAYSELLFSFEREFTYAFGGCTTVRGLEGSYLSQDGRVILDRVNLIYTDLPLAFSIDFKSVERYADELKRVVSGALAEESVMVVVTQVYHAVGSASHEASQQRT